MVHFHKLAVCDIRRETNDAISVAFDVPTEHADAYRFVQGQHLTLKALIDGGEVRRSYSICVGPDDGELRVAVKKVSGGRFSTFANTHLRLGDKIDVMTPSGAFNAPVEPSAARIYVAFASGSGITPIMSILKTALAREPESRFILVYGNRSTATILFRDALEDLKNRYMERLSLYHVLSREDQEIDLLNGRVDAEKVGRMAGTVFDPGSVDHAFICGPSTMIDDVSAALGAAGVDGSRIHFERFSDSSGVDIAPAPSVEKISADGPAVYVVRDGVRTALGPVAKGATILDAGLAQGLDLPFSCKGGACSTCRAKVLEGSVKMVANYALNRKEVADGYVLTCQSRPTADRVVVDYDA